MCGNTIAFQLSKLNNQQCKIEWSEGEKTDLLSIQKEVKCTEGNLFKDHFPCGKAHLVCKSQENLMICFR